MSSKDASVPCFVTLHVIDKNYILDATAAAPG